MNENKTQHETDEKRTERTARTEVKKVMPSQASMDQLARIARTVGEDISEYVRKRPVAAVGIAAGAGFALGSVFGSRLGRMALTVAAGYAVQELVDAALGEDGLKKLVSNEISRLTHNRSAS